MCLYIKKLHFKGQYKKGNWQHNVNDPYFVDTWYKCGTCDECLKQKAQAWVVRNVLEARQANRIYFITLTYNNQNKPATTVDGIRQMQLFIKRMRKQTKSKFRYCMVTEYGTKGNRIHHHILLYIKDDYKINDLQLKKVTQKNIPLYLSQKITTYWGNGHTSIQHVDKNDENVMKYVALYISPNKQIKAYVTKKNKILYREQSIEFIREAIKKDYRNNREKISASIGLGYDEYMKDHRYEDLNEKIYLGNSEYFVPNYWHKKNAELGCKAEQELIIKRQKDYKIESYEVRATTRTHRLIKPGTYKQIIE